MAEKINLTSSVSTSGRMQIQTCVIYHGFDVVNQKQTLAALLKNVVVFPSTGSSPES